MTTPTPAGQPSTFGKGCLWLILAPVLLIGACTVFGGGGDDDGSSSSGKSSAIVLCRNSVKQQLKSPSSAKFGWGNETTSVASGTEKNGTIKVIGVVDADNSFGASLRSSWSCEATVVDGEATRAVATIDEG